MKKIIILVMLVLVAFMGCDMNSLVSNATEYDNSTGYVYILNGNKVLLINTYEQSTSKFLDAGDAIIAVSEIPDVGTVVETELGKYYVESGDSFVELAVPGDGVLHICQFSRYTIGGKNYIYFGVDDKLYRDTDTDFSDAELVINGNIFNSAPDTLRTNLHYIVDIDDKKDDTFAAGSVRYWPGDLNSAERGHEYVVENGNIVKTYGMVEQSVRMYLHIAYISMEPNGTLCTIGGDEVTFDNITSSSNVLGYVGVGWGQKQNLSSDLLVNNRININSSDWYDDTKIYMRRDTMFREFRDHFVYTVANTDRMYLCLDYSDGNNVTVKSVEYNSGALSTKKTFTVPLENGNLIPNMWVDTNGDIYIIIDNTLYLNGSTSVVYAHSSRLDAVTILPTGDIIVMDENGDWYYTTGEVYDGANIVAEY